MFVFGALLWKLMLKFVATVSRGYLFIFDSANDERRTSDFAEMAEYYYYYSYDAANNNHNYKNTNNNKDNNTRTNIP